MNTKKTITTFAVGASLLLLSGCGGGGSSPAPSGSSTPTPTPSPTPTPVVVPPTPVLTSISPSSGKVGDTITIHGANFVEQTPNYVYLTPPPPGSVTQVIDFGGTAGFPVTRIDANTLTVQVPAQISSNATHAQVTIAQLYIDAKGVQHALYSTNTVPFDYAN